MNVALIYSHQREQWRIRHLYCHDDVPPLSLSEAHYVTQTHGDHIDCRQNLAAYAYSGHDEDPL